MKVFLLLCLCALTYGYDDISESFDIMDIFTHPDKEREYINCFLDKGPCTESVALQKSHIQQVLEDGCQECTPIQKNKTKMAFKLFAEKYTKDLMEMRAKYDPEGKYFENFVKIMTEGH